MKKNHVLMEKLPEDRINKSKIVALMNNKGGCGKTSTSIALGMYLIRTGHNVLFWDNDPQSNLTQRLGLPDDKCEDKRINALFRSADMRGFEKDQRNLASIVEYPYIYKIKGTIAYPGKVGLMAGDHNAEIEANAATQKLKNTGFSRTGPKDIFSFFDSSIRFYSSYFDYIIVDTAPAIEGNILNRLAARVADEIICPVDGIEAALGMRNFLGWLSGENNIPNNVYPNVTLAMVKYQADTKNLGANPSLRMRNSVFRAMKSSFGDFVCDNGVKELQRVRSSISGFKGNKFDYLPLCEEIVRKLETPRRNIFDEINSDTFAALENDLLELHAKIQDKTPKFKLPYYDGSTGTQTTLMGKSDAAK